MTEAVKKKQIFQIAKELNISHDDIIKFLEQKEVSVSSRMMKVDTDTYDMILHEFSREHQQVARYRKEKARMVVVDTRRKVPKDDVQKHDDGEPLKPTLKKFSKETISQELKERVKRERDRLSEEKKKKEPEETVPGLEQKDQKNEVTAREKKEPISKLKIIRYPTDEEKEILKDAKLKKHTTAKSKKPKPEKIAAGKKKPAEQAKPVHKPRKLKKIDIASIADKINQTRSGKSSKNGVKKPGIPKFGTKLRKRSRKQKKTAESVEITEVAVQIIRVPEFTSAEELAQSMNVPVNEIIVKSMNLGIMVTINQRLDMETMILIADEFGFEIETIEDVVEDLIISSQSKAEEDENAVSRAPVVTVMGHVDHGKTSLLDYIRNENVVAGEAGGITQHIGAYEVLLESGNKITFLDTPGHAAFTAMRARGAQVTDIVIVIVAADDGVMPQTIEAIDHARAAGVPIIVAINKIDRPESNSDKIKQQLTEQKLVIEDFGGNVQCAEISAKTGEGIPVLMEKILLEAEILDLRAPYGMNAQGVVIESRLDKGLGAVATVLIGKGTLKKGDIFICGTQYSKVRALMNERNVKIDQAIPSDPVQVLGFEKVPNAGDSLIVMDDEREARRITQQRNQLKREAEHRRFRHLTLDQIGKQISEGELQNLDIIIKGDVDGSIEALSDSLMVLSNKEVAVNIIHRSVGMVTENDVSLASASSAIIIAFNAGVAGDAKSQAKNDKVEIRNYNVIYDAVNDVKLALEGLLAPDKIEEALGIAEVRETFKIGRREVIAGSYVRSGKAIRKAMLRVVRGEEVIHSGLLTSLKRFKDDVNEVNEGYECGISVDGFNDFIEGDMIHFYEIVEVKRKLA